MGGPNGPNQHHLSNQSSPIQVTLAGSAVQPRPVVVSARFRSWCANVLLEMDAIECLVRYGQRKIVVTVGGERRRPDLIRSLAHKEAFQGLDLQSSDILVSMVLFSLCGGCRAVFPKPSYGEVILSYHAFDFFMPRRLSNVSKAGSNKNSPTLDSDNNLFRRYVSHAGNMIRYFEWRACW